MAKKNKNFKDMSAGDLDKKLISLQSDLQTIRFKAEGSRSKNVKEVKNLRKDIARVLTAMNSK